jgi:hypothetical protein
MINSHWNARKECSQHSEKTGLWLVCLHDIGPEFPQKSKNSKECYQIANWRDLSLHWHAVRLNTFSLAKRLQFQTRGRKHVRFDPTLFHVSRLPREKPQRKGTGGHLKQANAMHLRR